MSDGVTVETSYLRAGTSLRIGIEGEESNINPVVSTVIPTMYVDTETKERCCYVLVPKSRVDGVLDLAWRRTSPAETKQDKFNFDYNDIDPMVSDESFNVAKDDKGLSSEMVDEKASVGGEEFSTTDEEGELFWVGSGHTVTCYRLNDDNLPDLSKEVWKKEVNKNDRPFYLRFSCDKIVVSCGLRMHVLNAADGREIYTINMASRKDCVKEDRPLSRQMSFDIADNELYLSTGYFLCANNLRSCFEANSVSLRGDCKELVSAFSSVLVCENSIVVGIPGTVICLSPGLKENWRKRLLPDSYYQSDGWHGEVPTFTYVGDDTLFCFCSEQVSVFKLEKGIELTRLGLSPSSDESRYTLNVYNKEMDKDHVYVLSMGTLSKISVHDPPRIVKEFKLQEGTSPMDITSMAADEKRKRLYIAFANVETVLCVDCTRLKRVWVHEFQTDLPDSRIVTTLSYSESMLSSGGVILGVGNEIHILNPDDGSEAFVIKTSDDDSVICSVCTRDSFFDTQSSGFLHSVYTSTIDNISC